MALLLLPLCFGATTAHAVIRLAAPFGDHMVLPHDVPVTLWGSGCPGGDTVVVYIAGQSASARSDWQGNWKVTLAPMKSGGPYQLLVQIGGAGPYVFSPATTRSGGAEINDVLIGEVIQAPPAAGLEPVRVRGKAPAGKPLAVTTHPYAWVRVYRSAQDGRPARWLFISQDSVPPDVLVLFNLGRDAYAKGNIPVGIIDTSNGPVCSVAPCPSMAADSRLHSD